MRGKWFAPPSGGYYARDPDGRLAARGPGRPPKIPATPEGVRAAAALEAEHEPTGGLHAFMGVICCCGSAGASHEAHLAEVLAESSRNQVTDEQIEATAAERLPSFPAGVPMPVRLLADSLACLVPGQPVTRIWGRDEAAGSSPFAANVWAGSPEDVAAAVAPAAMIALADFARERIAVEVLEQVCSRMTTQADQWRANADRHRADALATSDPKVRKRQMRTALAFSHKASAMSDAIRLARGEGADSDQG